MWMIELTANTPMADSSMGSQSEKMDTMMNTLRFVIVVPSV
jgi:hypothetical protein